MSDPNMFDRLFNPHGVAVVGASTDPSKIGNAILRNMMDSGYRGNIFPVNPSAGNILGMKSYRSLAEIGEIPDLVVIALPSSKVPASLMECTGLRVPFVIIVSGGFSELGEDGRKREEELKEIAGKSGTRIIGPNTLGIYLPHSGVNTSLTPADRVTFPPAGNIAFLSQSGALGVLTLDGMSEYGIGVSAFLNLGNRSDLNEVELLDYFSRDEATRSIITYLESVPEGRAFFDRVREISVKKPVVILKAGRTHDSARAASLHTGAMASDDAIVDGAIAQSGAVRAYDETEMIDYGRVLAYSTRIRGDRIAIVTTAGGVGVITADYISSRSRGVGLSLAKLSESCMDEIKEVIVPYGSHSNPVDLTADGSVESFSSVIEILQREQGVDGIIAYPLPQTPKMGIEVVESIEKFSKNGKPVVSGVLGFRLAKDLLIEFEKRRMPAYPSIERAVKSMKALYTYSRHVGRRIA